MDSVTVPVNFTRFNVKKTVNQEVLPVSLLLLRRLPPLPIPIPPPASLTPLRAATVFIHQVTGMCLGVVNARSNGVVASTFGRTRPNLTKTLVNWAKHYGERAIAQAHITQLQPVRAVQYGPSAAVFAWAIDRVSGND